MALDPKKFCHPDYLAKLPDYTKIRDCFDGERAIKDRGEVYLPRLSGQSQKDYDNYKYRALFFPITGKTVGSMVGLAITKPPKLEYPTIMESYFTDDSVGQQFTEFYVSLFTEIVLMGRYGVLIDAPMAVMGQPMLVPYRAENIVNWDFAEDGTLQMLLLKEYVRVKGDSKFEIIQECRYRHCFIDTDGVYKVEVLDDEMKPIGPVIIPRFSGEAINYIPWTPYGASGVHMMIDKPPMQDISTINVSHYLSSADLEWGRHMVGLPTPVVSGVDSGTSLKIGGTAAWILPVVEAKAYFLEFEGQGLQSLEKAMTEKVGLMASVSARMVDSSTRGSEAAETVRLRYVSESASLIHIISAIEAGATMMYNMLANLMKAGGSVKITFSREVLGVGITFRDLDVLFNAYLRGSITKESLLYNLRRLDALDPNRTDAQELAGMKDPPPISTTTPAASQPTT